MQSYVDILSAQNFTNKLFEILKIENTPKPRKMCIYSYIYMLLRT